MSLLVAGAVAVTVGTVTLFAVNMDEFLPYHADSCRQPAQLLNMYREACDAYPISFMGIEYLRAYAYVGATSSFLIQPLSMLGRGEWNHLLLGIIALALVSTGIARSMRAAPWTALIVPLIFPLTFALVRDTGPTRVAAVVIAWTPVILRWALTPGPRAARAARALPLILLWLIAVEDKPFFLFLLPLTFLWSLAGLARAGSLPRSPGGWIDVGSIFGVGSLLSVLVLWTMRVPSGPYLLELMRSTPSDGPLLSTTRGLRYVLAWPSAAHRSVDLAGAFALSLQAVSAVVVLSVAIVILRAFRHRHEDHAPVLLLVLAGVAAFAGVVLARGWAIHHFAFVLIPAAALCIVLIDRDRQQLRRLTLPLSIATGAALVAGWVLPATVQTSPEIDVLMTAAVRTADTSTVINCASWGCYYQYAYVGREQVPVVFTASVGELRQLAADLDGLARTIHVCRNDACDRIEEVFEELGWIVVESRRLVDWGSVEAWRSGTSVG